MPPDDSAPPPEIIAGRRIRCTTVTIAPDLLIDVLEAADADAAIDDAIRSDGDAYAAILWPSAIATAARLTTLLTPGRSVLDLGAGTGLVALTAAALGANAIAADHDPFAREVIRHAAARLGRPIDIIDFDVDGDEPLPPTDIVVMADLLYEPALARAAGRRALQAHAAGAIVLIGDPARYGRAELERVLADGGLNVHFEEALAHVPGDPAAARVGIALIEPAR